MFRAILIFFVAILLAAAVAAQSKAGAQGSTTQPAEGASQSGAPERDARSSSANGAFSEAVVDRLLKRINDGFTAHSAPVVLSTFDRSAMKNYTRFAGQLQSTFAQYESFRVHFHIAEVAAHGDAGTALVEVEYEAAPLSEVSPPVRKGGLLRFQFGRSGATWKITGMQPWNFFL